jgi:hypothetical protein
MACNLTSGWLIDCKSGVGGVEKVFIANGPVSGYTASEGVVTEITVDDVALNSSDFFKFEVPKQTSSLTESVEASVENGTVVYNQALTLIFNKMEASKRNQILLMAANENLIVIVKDNNLKYWSVGLTRGANLTGAELTTGTAYSDRNGGTLTLTGIESAPMFEVDGDIVEGAVPSPSPTPEPTV